jgi:two-component system, cell cycle sensor histidine kinase and response regulator CckA
VTARCSDPDEATNTPERPAGDVNQSALLESEQLFRSAFDDAAVGMLIVDPAGRLLHVNQAFAGMLGYTPQELSGRSFQEITHPDDVAGNDNVRAEMVRDGESPDETIVKRYLHKDGGIRWARLSVSAVRDDDNRLLHLVGQVEDITELRETQAGLEESERRFRGAFDDAAVGMLLTDPDGVLLRVNAALAAMLGYEQPEALLGRNVTEITHPDDLPQVMADVAAIRAGSPDLDRRRLERRYLRRDGSVVWGHVGVSVVRDDDGRLLYFATQVEDITELRKTQTELVESERRFRDAFETAVTGMTLADRDGTFLRVNATFATMLGYTPADLVGRRIDEFVHPDELANLFAGRRSLLTGGSIRRVNERRYVCRNGETKLAKVGVSAVRGDDGSLMYTVAQIEDVTELRRTQRDLADREALQRVVFDSSRDMLAIFEPDGALQLVSPVVEVLLGHEPASLVGKSFTAFIHPDDLQACLEAVASALDGEASSNFRARFRAADGSYRLFEGTVSPGRGPDGRVTYLVSNSRDVTEQVALEDQFRHAQKMEVVGRLAGGVAHDFNNLLLAIRGYGELARLAAAEGKDNTAEIDEIMAAAGRAGGLTAQLLAFSRRQVLNPVLLDLGAVVTDMVSMLRRMIRGDVELVTQLPERPAFVRADRAQMEQVIANLAVNASAAMPDGGTLTIEIGPSPEGQKLLLRVRDTGTGMDAATAAQIFEPFFTTKGVAGTGLGLSMVHGIVNQSGGSIAVESTPGEGTTFMIELPLAEPGELPEQASSAASPEGGAETILLVEDDPLVQKVVARMLEQHGYRIIVAASGEEAVPLAHADPDSIDLIVTDLVMPGMNGRETAKALRDDQPLARVLYMSGYTDDVVIRVGGLGPGVAFIQKPFSGEDLAHRVRELLNADL